MPRTVISEREQELPLSTIGKLLRISSEDKSIISLGPGEPDFNSPRHIIQATKKWLDRGYTHYSAPGGRAELKEAIVRKLGKENRIKAGPENIVVTAGSTEAIFLSLLCTVDPGEGVIMTDPGFLAYKPSIEVLNGMPIPVPLKEESGFQLDIEEARERIIPEKTNVMIINTPTNPTGTVYSKKTLEEVADFAVENDIIILSDEAYEKFVYENNRHISIGSLNGMQDRVITLHSFSKTYAMSGFRIGYAAGPEKIIGAMAKVHVFSSISASTISQLAALEALRGPQGCIGRMLREYDRRRRFIYRRVGEIEGFRCAKPEGAFYLFPNISSFGMGSDRFAEFLMKKAKVAVMTGAEFGRMGEGFIRLSYATKYELIEKAMDRIERAVKGLLK